MTFLDIAHESWLSISGNKMRSFLTVLGIVIGIMAVVIMVAVGETVQQSITDQFSSLGTNTIMIRAGAAQSAGVRGGNRMTLTMDDIEDLAKLPDVAAISPTENSGAQVVYGNKNWSTSMVGVYPGYATVKNIEMQYGSFFEMSAVRMRQPMQLLDQKPPKNWECQKIQ
ncbi:MAG: ABC transporter permease [Alphaproteobacteria bacterium]|nr:ABC transporter permease [Alphaproteobacteria bacterium]